MHISLNAVARAGAALVFWCGPVVHAQPDAPRLHFIPSILTAGGPARLDVYGPSLHAGLAGRWNGQDRPTSAGSSSESVTLSLRAEDVARPGLAEITLFDTQAGVELPGASYILVGYAVNPRGMVYDSVRKRFYIATPRDSRDPRFPPNSVVAVDPETDRIGPTLNIGVSLGAMALAEDGSALYVVAETDGTVRRLDPERLTQISEFRFRAAGAHGPYSPADSTLAVMPGQPGTVALCYAPPPSVLGPLLAIFDGGVKRPQEIRSSRGCDGLLFSPDARYVFQGSFALWNSPLTVTRFTVGTGGAPTQEPQTAVGGGPVIIRNGVLYTSAGVLVSVENMEPVGNLGVSGGLAVDEATQRILVLRRTGMPGSARETLQAFDLLSHQPLGSIQVAGVPSLPESSYHLFRWGRDGIAYRSQDHLFMFRTPLAGPAPLIESRAIVSAASLSAGPIAPGEILTIYGANLGPERPRTFVPTASGRVSASLANVQVWFGHLAGTVLFASAGQLNVIAPFGLQPGSTVRAQVWHMGIPSAQIPLTVFSSAPALFTRDGSGRGLVAVVNQDGSINAPAPPGGIITLFGTGGGRTQTVVDGSLAFAASPLGGSVGVYIGGQRAEALYAGTAPGLVHGVFQLNVRIPSNLPGGTTLPVLLQVDGRDSPAGVTLEIR